MGKDPALLWYPNDWIGGTMGMTLEQKGAYFELLMAQFNRGHMTTHMIGQLVGQNWDTLKDKFIQDENGLWYNKRLEDEKNKRQSYVKSRNNNRNGKNQYTKESSYDQPYEHEVAPHMENENENENENEDKKEKTYLNPAKLNDFFELIWKRYPNKKGKAAIKDKQKKILYEIGYEHISRCIKRYVETKEDWRAYKDGSTFFNGGYIDYLDENYINLPKPTTSAPYANVKNLGD